MAHDPAPLLHPGAPSAAPAAPGSPTRGVTVSLDLPDVPTAVLVELAGTLHSLARDLAPDAPTRTDVRLGTPAPDADPRYLTDPRPPRHRVTPPRKEHHVHDR
ncbi:hypothetical protein OEB99_04590 [Actinotalea sp. M2MS4P-6]|uniref:hypothetical protein n=1 Tax=Actinotalea sp. M2MS4P-6 TaxID=2983762 RepID=UPI0021E45296|nr:hypothetical protein [Actinotalea sp. M2MS4P-6]MCV2393578.1 hypothetical protein [Actinotalea sp. M2MS4P-6]